MTTAPASSPLPASLQRVAPEDVVAPVTSFAQTTLDPEFAFATLRRVSLEVQANDDQGLALVGTRVTVDRLDGSRVLAGRTDAEGRLRVTVSLPSAERYLRVTVDTVGIVNEQLVAVVDAMRVDFGA